MRGNQAYLKKQAEMNKEMQQLRQQNRMLYEENQTLKQSLEELITINSELTESVEQFNQDRGQNINREEIQQLAHQVIELQQELDRTQQELQHTNQALNATQQQLNATQQELYRVQSENGAGGGQGAELEQTVAVIQELVTSIRGMQDQYQEELTRIENQLSGQRQQWLQVSDTVQEKLSYFQQEYQKLLQQLRKSQSVIKRLEEEGGKPGMSKKQLKISMTIEDLRVTLERQIEEKQKIIRFYQNLIDEVQNRLRTKPFHS